MPNRPTGIAPALPPEPPPVPRACRYRAYGMTIEVDRPVPRLTPCDGAGGDPVSLEIGSVPLALENVESSDEFFQANGREYLYRQPGSWAAIVRDGRSAVFEAIGNFSEELYWYIAITNSIGVAGYQRGMFPLHGSSVAFPGGMVAFVGHSGAGKTTLTAGMVLRGFPLVSDDLCLIRRDGASYSCGRGAPEIRLLGDAADALGWDRAQSIGYQPKRDKLAFVQHQAGIDDLPVRAVVELAFDEGPPRLERLQGVAPLSMLVAAIRLRMGLHLFPASQRMAGFELVSAMAQTIPIYRFTRPRSYGHFAEGADLLIREFAK